MVSFAEREQIINTKAYLDLDLGYGHNWVAAGLTLPSKQFNQRPCFSPFRQGLFSILAHHFNLLRPYLS
jgi:hypothetical protein